jgi:HEPN domain-containing protein
MISATETNYIIWQNRAFRFYLAARLLRLNEQYSTAAFCGYQAMETLMKATLLYWDKSFDPEAVGHKMAGMIRAIRNKVRGAKRFECPEYFYAEKRYQSVSRYPANGKGLVVPASFLLDIDRIFRVLVELVPFQYNSLLVNALNGRNRKDLLLLRKANNEVRQLRRSLNVRLEKKA